MINLHHASQYFEALGCWYMAQVCRELMESL
jgi:hypothetical protein